MTVNQADKPETITSKSVVHGKFCLMDILEMDTYFALFQSMRRSKTLTTMVIIGSVLAAVFVLFLFKMAGH